MDLSAFVEMAVGQFGRGSRHDGIRSGGIRSGSIAPAAHADRRHTLIGGTR